MLMNLILFTVSFVVENTPELEVKEEVRFLLKIQCGEIFTTLARLRVQEIAVLP